MSREARVVQLQSSRGSLSVELYDNSFADSFWQLACSGQLRRLVFRRLLAGFALLGEVDDVCARCTTLSEVEEAHNAASGSRLCHVGAGLLSCRPEVGVVSCRHVVLTLSPQPELDATHVVFGRVYSGFQTVETIASMQVDARFQLYTPVTVLKCSTALLPKGATPAEEEETSAETGYEAKSVSTVPLVSLLE